MFDKRGQGDPSINNKGASSKNEPPSQSEGVSKGTESSGAQGYDPYGGVSVPSRKADFGPTGEESSANVSAIAGLDPRSYVPWVESDLLPPNSTRMM